VLYQVFIPALKADGFNITLKLEAPNWISALRSGLSKLGEQGDVIKNVIVAIQPDGTIQVSDPKTRRVFEIKELPAGAAVAPEAAAKEAAAKEAAAKEAAARHAAAVAAQPTQIFAPAPPEPTAAQAQAAADENLATVMMEAWSPPTVPTTPAPPQQPAVRIDPGAAPVTASEVEVPVEPTAPAVAVEPTATAVAVEPTVTAVAVEPTRPAAAAATEPTRMHTQPFSFAADEKKAVSSDPSSQILEEDRSVPVPEDPALAPRQALFSTEEVLADVFMDAQRIYDYDTDLQSSVEFALDLLMEKIPAQAGSVLFADIPSNSLYFASARGPKAREILDLRVPIGRGLVGFCAKEGVSLAVGDAARDPRFYRKIGEQIGFETRSVVCAPVEADGRCYGAVELINKTGTDAFTPGEMSVVTYVANRLADHINQVVLREA